jgi:hypothetical protein
VVSHFTKRKILKVTESEKNVDDNDSITYGTGIEITTSLSSRFSCRSSYSMLTSHCPSFSEGQQFTVAK